MGCLILIVLIVVVAIVGSWVGGSTPAGKPDPTRIPIGAHPDLNASARFDGERFYVTNHDDVDWKNCDLILNLQVFGDNYTAALPAIAAHATVSIGAMQIAKGDGERFNPFTHKAKDIGITCETPMGKLSYGGTLP